MIEELKRHIKIVLKIVLMNTLYLFLAVYGFFKRKPSLIPRRELKIGILFLSSLGFGDLIMLSPVIQAIADIFSDSQIYLVNRFKEIICFKGLKWVGDEEGKRMKFDLVISPTLNLHHIPFIFKSKYWLGYFAKPRMQSNFSKILGSYNPRKGHFLLKGFELLKALNIDKSIELEEKIKVKNVIYPKLCLKESTISRNLKGIPYLAFAPFSAHKERQWPFSYFAEVIKFIINKNLVQKIVLLGGNSNWEEKQKEKLMKYLKDMPILDLVGKISLQENFFIIKNSSIFMGLDSGPSHAAYCLGNKTIVIFVSVDPLDRIPLSKTTTKIFYFIPKNCPGFPLYSGLWRPNYKKCQKWALTIKAKEVIKKLSSIV